ncbi:MAG: RHS repeat-associated core domain-containing protein [Muribaculaceae bacterium]|nr:RHS repeat-associated core domain-containing protein [Muribaculaceae bacterium]
MKRLLRFTILLVLLSAEFATLTTQAATDVTINGTKQRVSAVSYDDLGRIASVTRGAEQNSGRKVSYTYNIHGQTTSITGPGFSQNLYYADWRGTKLYNGSVSAMTWTMGPGTARRGYKYSYNDYGWLTSADYGESDALNAYRDRYSEKSTAFTLNGSITKLQRNGLKADGTYGKIDDLTLSYAGNRVTGISDSAPVVTQNGSMDYPGGNTSKVPTYNAFGALVSDYGRGITSIDYDNFGNPTKIQYSGNRSTSNVYSASGEKLKTVHYSGLATLNEAAYLVEEGKYSVQADDMNIVGISGRSAVEYHGNVIYRAGKVHMILFPGCYATLDDTSATFHYYTQDYLGNNRAVINGSTGAIEQTVAYYPYGGIIADLGTAATTGQPYKFGGKELMTAKGLYEYDFGARQYYSAVPGFTRIDPMAEKYLWLSPYLYCANNPVNAIDPDGNIIIFVNGFHCGDGGRSEYWNGVDTSIQQLLNDDHVAYIDGSFGGIANLLFSDISTKNIKASNRIRMGSESGRLLANSIYESLSEGETIKIITHSMGAASAKGFIKALIRYAKKHKIRHRIVLELDLAPFQSTEQEGDKDVSTYTISHKFDKLAGLSDMKNAKNFHTRTDKDNGSIKTEHGIASFKEEVVKLIKEGKIKTSVIY